MFGVVLGRWMPGVQECRSFPGSGARLLLDCSIAAALGCVWLLALQQLV